jgi:fatty-acyl-CoA synthase
MRRVVERMHMREVRLPYGMTETSPVSFQSSPHDSLERRVDHRRAASSRTWRRRIIDTEGQTVPRGEAGELCSRGYAVMLGYWTIPHATAEAIDVEGWMHTGDLG